MEHADFYLEEGKATCPDVLRLRKGRGAPTNPVGRFETLDIEYEPFENDLPLLNTELFKDATKSVISYNDSPDLNFYASFNPYRGCEHVCD